MFKADEFRKYAHECLASAREADTAEKRDQFLSTASTWLKAAVLEEAREQSPEHAKCVIREAGQQSQPKDQSGEAKDRV